MPAEEDSQLKLVASSRLPQRGGRHARLKLCVARLPAYFTGTGAPPTRSEAPKRKSVWRRPAETRSFRRLATRSGAPREAAPPTGAIAL